MGSQSQTRLSTHTHRENMATNFIYFSEMHRLIIEAFPKEVKISFVGGQWCKLRW